MDKSIGDMKTMGATPEHGGYTLFEGDMLGQYRVIRALGRGGMGEVYEVEHTVLRRRYALKLLPDNFATHTGALERFQREAQVMAQLQHPHIVKVDEFGETGGRYWLRMECANGAEYGDGHITNLQDLAEAGKGRIGQETLAGILRQVLKALGHAHHQGVVHRDLKPSNILIFTDATGSSFKIADFGLVRLVGEDWVRSQAQLTIQRSMSMGELRTMAGVGSSAGSSTRSLLGTFEYMSPEQKRGEDATAASDMYAVGLMAFKLLTGRSLGMKKPSEIDSRLARGWDVFVGKALEEEPAERISSAEEALTLLDGIDADITVNRGGGSVPKPVVARVSRTEPSAMRERGAGPVPGQSWVSPTTGMEFVWIPQMKLWVGKHEVTNGEYRKKEPNHTSGTYACGGILRRRKELSLNGDRQPVVRVNFMEGNAYAAWMAGCDSNVLPAGYRYRLPARDEWMTFAQCGDGRMYPWGNNWPPISGQAGNYRDMAARQLYLMDPIPDYNDGHAVTAPVDALWENPWGLKGVGGNVWEMTSKTAGGGFDAWRGASWNRYAQGYLRCAYRYDDVGSYRSVNFGFRLVLVR